MKQIIFLQSQGPVETLHERLLQHFAAGGRSIGANVSVNLVADAAAPWHAVLEVWHGTRNAAGLSLSALDDVIAKRATYRVTELVEKDTGVEPGWPTAGVRLIVPWIGRHDVSPTELRRHWDEHVPLANRIHVGVSRYVRNWVEGSDAGAPPYQGIASQHFATVQDLLERSFDSPESVPVIMNDVADFIAEPVVLQVIEYRRQTTAA